MNTSGIIFLTTSGIVAVSDSDFSIRRLSRKFPGIITVNMGSPIPWKRIIDDYLLENDSRVFSTLQEAYDSFSLFFRERKIPSSMLKKQDKESILFLGFDEGAFYPSLMGAEIKPGENSDLEFCNSFVRNVSPEDCAFYHFIGDCDYVSPILEGASEQFMESANKIDIKLLSDYRDKLLSKMKGSSTEKIWIDKTEGFDVEEVVGEAICDTSQDIANDVAVGLDSLSIQELISYAEALQNAEIRLRNLKLKKNENPDGTREIAIVTIPEGLTWIKHPLFAI